MQCSVEPVISPGVAGVVVLGVIIPVDVVAVTCGLQPLIALTLTVPSPFPIVMVAAVVPCPDVTAQPVPVVDHV